MARDLKDNEGEVCLFPNSLLSPPPQARPCLEPSSNLEPLRKDKEAFKAKKNVSQDASCLFHSSGRRAGQCARSAEAWERRPVQGACGHSILL